MESRLRSALSLYAFTVLGSFLLFAPWTPVWGQAAAALLPEALGAWAQSGWLRGVVSALGALDLLGAAQVARELWGSMRAVGGRPQ